MERMREASPHLTPEMARHLILHRSAPTRARHSPEARAYLDRRKAEARRPGKPSGRSSASFQSDLAAVA